MPCFISRRFYYLGFLISSALFKAQKLLFSSCLPIMTIYNGLTSMTEFGKSRGLKSKPFNY